MNPIVKNILLGLLLLIVLYVIYNLLNNNSGYLTNMSVGNKEIVIDSKKLKNNNNSNNFSYSIWFFLDDWQYYLENNKTLLKRTKNNSSHEIKFLPYENNIQINIDSINNPNSNQTNYVNNCIVRNFPLQKWVHLLVSLNGRTLDVYLDGKLVRTHILPGVAKSLKDSDVQITPNGGFAGWTSRFQFWNDSLNPQEVYNIYKNGPGGSSSWLSYFDKYKIKLTWLVDNIEEGSVSL